LGYQIGLFISHAWDYSEHYNTLAEWVFKSGWQVRGQSLNFYDCSIPKDDPIHYAHSENELLSAIFERISQAHIVIIPAGMYVHHSEWIQREVAGAKFHGIPILAVSPWGQERHSSVAVANAQSIVGWNKQSVADGIWKLFSSKYRLL
jgi:hypothetical protein